MKRGISKLAEIMRKLLKQGKTLSSPNTSKFKIHNRESNTDGSGSRERRDNADVSQRNNERWEKEGASGVLQAVLQATISGKLDAAYIHLIIESPFN